MWHGTSSTDPKEIYNSEDGFSTQHANDNCFWGRAVYFAVNASYSCGSSGGKGYSYELSYGYKLSDGSTLPTGTKVVIYAKVIIGKEQFLDKEERGRNNPDAGFDSVKANTNGSDVYMLYKGASKRCYPMFLVYFD